MVLALMEQGGTSGREAGRPSGTRRARRQPFPWCLRKGTQSQDTIVIEVEIAQTEVQTQWWSGESGSSFGERVGFVGGGS